MNKDEAVKLILDTHEGFRSYWQEHLDFWEDEEPGITNDFSPYIQYVLELLRKENKSETLKACGLVEKFIIEGDQDVQYGATLGFLEGITNHLISNEKQAVQFCKMLQPKSREFCKELDSFWGTQTPGL
ncbi:DUF7674 family protein [Microbulbifer sediminum]|uniref:DUF7674 family protein n=1 Tax=Microbulbifer sediminum TaxID=2904250 RepID=UPI001F1AD1A9|nr:hypothetical protein [Microbulbifer sediminum]